MAGNEFLGTGMKFPPQINKATGRIMVSSLEQSVKESIYLILMTAKGERFMRPDYGSNLMSYTFMDVNSTTVGIMKRNLISYILTQEPRVSAVTLDIDDTSRPGALLVDINYTISGTNTKDNLVFPFYLNNDNEGGETDDSLHPDDIYTDGTEYTEDDADSDEDEPDTDADD